MEDQVYKLRKPFKSPFTGLMIEEVTVCEPKVGDIKKARKCTSNDDEHALKLIQLCIGLNDQEMDELRAGDLTKINEIASNFISQTDEI